MYTACSKFDLVLCTNKKKKKKKKKKKTGSSLHIRRWRIWRAHLVNSRINNTQAWNTNVYGEYAP